MIPYGRHDIQESDIEAVVKVLRSDFLTQGSVVPQFEKQLCDYTGSSYAVAVNSATSALHIACLSLGLEKGDWLWTSPNSFVASANCGLYCGAKIDFIDIDVKTYNLSIDKLEKKLICAKKEKKLPKIVIPVHFAGQSCDMKRIYSLSKQYGFKIIEDAAHAIGGRYLDSPIGGCQYSDITVFSFHPVKIITTAEGGLATTNSKKLAEKMQLYRSHGIIRNQELITEKVDGDWYYQQVVLGFNYRMTELQAALGVSQMKRLDRFVSSRHILRKRYDMLLRDLPITIPFQHKNNYSALHLYPIKIDFKRIGKSREKIFNELRASGVGVNVHYIPIHTQPYYKQFGFHKGDFPNAELYYHETISIPIFHAMTMDQQDTIVGILKKVLQ
jgi:UDP-4-amino-4,6-dideoxy-N-acetyl-beta-L-altrosamine transaminase